MPYSSKPNAIAWAIAGALLAGYAAQATAAEPFRWLTIDGAAVRWHPGASSAGFTLRYAIARSTSQVSGAINCSPLSPPKRLIAAPKIGPQRFRSAVTEAFARWQSVTAIRFIETNNEAAADIVIGEQAVPKGHAFTNVLLGGKTDESVRPIVKASICLNPERSWKIGFDGNLTSYDLVHTLTHEIGHAIGLDHPGPRGHLMSFRYDERLSGLSEGDVLGVRAIYGAPVGSGAPSRSQGTITARAPADTNGTGSNITRAFEGAEQ